VNGVVRGDSLEDSPGLGKLHCAQKPHRIHAKCGKHYAHVYRVVAPEDHALQGVKEGVMKRSGRLQILNYNEIGKNVDGGGRAARIAHALCH
jgi:hypothetical protein